MAAPCRTPATVCSALLILCGAPALLGQAPSSHQSPAPPPWATLSRPVGAAIEVPRFGSILEEIRRQGRTRVIVRLAPPPSLSAGFRLEGTLAAGPAVNGQRAALAAQQRGVLMRLAASTASRAVPFEFVPFMALDIDEADLLTLTNAPEVDLIEEDVPLPPLLAETIPLLGASPDGTFAGFSGTGTVVAVLDTGVDGAHPFFGGRVVEEACYSTTMDGYSETVCPNGLSSQTGAGAGANCGSSISGCHHGTHVAGIAAGEAADSSGVAKDASVIAIQVFSKFANQGSCGATPAPCALSFSSDQIAGLQRVYQLRDSYAIAAVNMSIGGGVYASYCDSTNVSLKAAIDNLRSVGIATVIASGNGSSATGISSPACVSSAVSVGSTTKLDAISSFSNSASILNLLAPGSSIRSSMPDGAYGIASGTSMAAPHVAGAWAVLKSKKPSATVDELLMALKSTGTLVLDTRNSIKVPRINLSRALSQVSSQGNTILWRGTDGRVVTWSMSGTARTAVTLVDGGKPVDLFWTIAGAADFNADGKTDILWRGADGRIVVWFMDGATRLGVTVLDGGNPLSLAWRIAGAADYNADGKPDILFRHTDGKLAVWYMNGVVRTGSALLDGGNPVDLAWTVAGTPDQDGDGKADILWRHTDGRIVVWFMNGITRSSVAFLNGGQAIDPIWVIVGTGDFNGDTRTDLLWRHADGRIAVWFMNGATTVSTTFLNNGATVGTQWLVGSAYGS